MTYDSAIISKGAFEKIKQEAKLLEMKENSLSHANLAQKLKC